MKISRILQILTILFISLMMVSCEYDFIESYMPPPPDPTDTTRFSAEIAPIFVNSGCTGCHNGGMAFDLTAGNAYDELMNGNYVVPFNPESSSIYTFPHPVSGTHHTRYDSNDDADLIYNWIYQGALNN